MCYQEQLKRSDDTQLETLEESYWEKASKDGTREPHYRSQVLLKVCEGIKHGLQRNVEVNMLVFCKTFKTTKLFCFLR